MIAVVIAAAVIVLVVHMPAIAAACAMEWTSISLAL